jgi:hypothetical protein
MIHTDYKNRVVYILQTGTQRKRVKVSGAERVKKNGDISFKQGRLKYGVSYTQSIKGLVGKKTKIRGKDGKYWKIKICDIGTTPFHQKFGKAKKRQVMGRVKHRNAKHKFQGINRLDWSKI